jgi:acetylornithine deacetylase
MIDKDIQQRICNAADNLEQDYVRTLQQLVRIPSVVGNEADAQRFMAELYRSFGLDVVVFEAKIDKVSTQPAFLD